MKSNLNLPEVGDDDENIGASFNNFNQLDQDTLKKIGEEFKKTEIEPEDVIKKFRHNASNEFLANESALLKQAQDSKFRQSGISFGNLKVPDETLDKGPNPILTMGMSPTNKKIKFA